MRMFKHARSTTAAIAALSAAALITTSTGAVAKPPPSKDPSKSSRDFRKAVTVRGITQHLDALQKVADANGGTRASGTPGYGASKDYVVKKLRAAGYRPTVQTFPFDYFKENAPATMERTAPTPKTYSTPADFSTMTFSGSGGVTAAVVAVDTTLTPVVAGPEDSTSGCEAADFAGFTPGSIALMQRGTCPFGTKAANAEAAGATGVVIFNRGSAGATDSFAGTLGTPVGIPAVGTSFANGVELGAAGTQLRLVTDTVNEQRTTFNVFAETKRGNPDNVVMTGAHLDSVDAGPGINDNGSGSATILEIAEQMAKVKKPKNKVRFAWWGAEELNLLGSTYYVTDLVENNEEALGDIALYLNFDMVGSPNFVRFVYDGDNSTGVPASGPAPEGSAEIESIFSGYFDSQGLASSETAFDGRSDYGPFIANGVPAGGLFTGAEGVKTAEEAATYGGTAGAAYDPCYHRACDTRANISMRGLDKMSDAAAHAIFVLARSTKAVNGQGSGHHSTGKTKLATRGQLHLDGEHRSTR
ncbi:MAG: M28 family metallopeptidase [Marmoricola sp.]